MARRDLPEVARQVKHYREKARMNQEETERAFLKHNYKFSRGYCSLVETGRTDPSFDFLRACELVYALPARTLTCYWVGNRAETKHMTAYEFQEQLKVYLQSKTRRKHPNGVEKDEADDGEDKVEEPRELAALQVKQE